MKDRLRDRLKSFDLHFAMKLGCCAFFIAVFVITVWICVEKPVHQKIKKKRKNDVWFGEGWHDTATGEKVTAVSQHYLRILLEDGHASITKTLDFTPLPEEYLCFRVRALDTVMYVNGEVWYEKHFSEKYRSHSRRMYLLHQVSADGMKAGDTITLELHVESGEDHAMFQFPAMGDRYALVAYILRKAKNSLGICLVAMLIMMLTLIASHSEILVDKEQDVKSLRWLTVFLAASVVYLGTDCGVMEILIERTSIVSWFNSLSLITLPIPFIMFTKYAFFPGHRRYDLLALLDFMTAMASVAMFVFFAYNMSNFYILIHTLIAFGIVACILSFYQEKLVPSFEVSLGFAAIIITVSASVALYWKELVYPSSVVFGYGLLVFSICMLIWIIRRRYEWNRMREEAKRVMMERDKVAAQEASEQKSRFLSSMSHEIRTPLNAILGLNELIMHESSDGKIKKYAADIQSAGRTLLALINDILDFSKIETGKMDIVLSDYSLSAVLSDIVVMIQERIGKAGLELRLDIDSTLPDVLYGDEVRIKQIIVNIMTNAVKYTKEGWIELVVRKQSASDYLDEENIMLDIRVSDTGVGIKEEDQSKLFVEFERLDRLKNRSIEGTGLGLSITSRLIGLMNGKISVESTYGKGSTFKVLIPQRVVSDTPIGDYRKRFEGADSAADGETLDTMRFPDKKVFVVDDNEMNLEVIASILEMLEIQVERANGGQPAKERLDREKYDLILTDDMMPEISGTELMQYLHANAESVSHDTPIVVLTANAIAGAREEYIRKGFDDYMTKPIDVDVLQKILMKYLK